MTMGRSRLVGVVITGLLAAATMDGASAQPRPRVSTVPFTPRVIALAPAKAGAPTITVSSPDFAGQNYQDKRFFQTVNGGLDMAPGVAWSAGPAGTQSYVLVMEGEGGERPHPTVHWIVYDIPSSATSVPRGIPTDVHVADPAGALQGLQNAATEARGCHRRGRLQRPQLLRLGRRAPPLLLGGSGPRYKT